MKLAVVSSKLTGNPGKSGWSQVHDFKPADKDKFLLRGHLFAVVSTNKSQEGVEGVEVGRELITRLHEEYFGDIQKTAFNALTSSVEKVIAEFTESLGVIEISAASFLGDAIYTVSGGGAGISILRSGMLATVLKSNFTENDKVASASGYPEDGDVLILGTRSFFSLFTYGQIRAALEGNNPRDAVEKLAPVVHSEGGGGDVGAAFLSFREASFRTPPASEKSEITSGKKTFVISSLAKSIKENVAKRLRSVPNKAIFVNAPKDEFRVSKSRKIYVSAGAMLLVLLVVSMVFGIAQKNQKEEKTRYEDRLVSAQHQFDESINLYSLDAPRARELFRESSKTADALSAEGVSDPQLAELLGNLEGNRGKILGEYKGGVELFVELPLVSDGFTGKALVGTETQAFVLNEDGNRIIAVSYATKGSEVVAGPEQVEGARTITAYSDRVFVIKSDGIVEIDENGGRTIGRNWGGNVLVYSYAGNIYILDKERGSILRYAGTESEFSSGASWLASGVEPDFSNIISWSIDGSIWLLDESGKINKYSLGNPQNFVIEGVDPAFTHPTAIYTSEGLDYIYILDPENSRVVVLDKEGQYSAQYEADEIKEASDLVVSESEGKIILLKGEKLYSIELKHLG